MKTKTIVYATVVFILIPLLGNAQNNLVKKEDPAQAETRASKDSNSIMPPSVEETPDPVSFIDPLGNLPQSTTEESIEAQAFYSVNNPPMTTKQPEATPSPVAPMEVNGPPE